VQQRGIVGQRGTGADDRSSGSYSTATSSAASSAANRSVATTTATGSPT